MVEFEPEVDNRQIVALVVPDCGLPLTYWGYLTHIVEVPSLVVGLLDEEKNVYGCDESEGQKIGEKLISLEGI
jgi:hypothetical protein